jgi:hypothetical protein
MGFREGWETGQAAGHCITPPTRDAALERLRAGRPLFW